ncbi:MAG: MFS transporter [Moorellales bacterium]
MDLHLELPWPPSEGLPDRAAVSMVNFLLSAAVQSSVIFIPLLAEELGANDWQVGLVGSAYGTAFLLASLFSGWKSDVSGRLFFVRLGLAASGLAFAAQILAADFYLLVLVRAAVGFSLGVTTAALIAYAYDSGADMGRFSSYGSLGWIAGALGAAVLKEFWLLFAASSLFCWAALAVALTLKEAPPQARPQGVRLWPVLRRNRHIYFGVFLRHLGATAVWIILPLYLAAMGLNRTWIGVLWGVNFVSQFVAMRYLGRYSPVRIFALGQALSVAVFVAYAYVRPGPALLGVQALLGVAWSGLYIGALLLALGSGEERGTAAGLLQSTINLCNAVGPFLGGGLAHWWGYREVMLFAAGLGVIGLLLRPATLRSGRIGSSSG